MSKGKSEQKRIRGRNLQDTLTQINQEYHAGNGWAIKKVNSSLMNVDVIVERSTSQANEDDKDAETISKEVDAQEKPEQTSEASSKKVATKTRTTSRSKKTSE